MADRVFLFFLPDSETLSLPAGPRCKDLAYRIGDGKNMIRGDCSVFVRRSIIIARSREGLGAPLNPAATHMLCTSTL